jgi:hypothetical protein
MQKKDLGVTLAAWSREVYMEHASKPNPEPTQAPIKWVPGAISPGVKQSVREAEHSTPK